MAEHLMSHEQTVVSTGCGQTLKKTWSGLTLAACRYAHCHCNSHLGSCQTLTLCQNTQGCLFHFVSCVHVPQDEREVKRQRRKQSNRESARRSRLRKQAECEALAVRVNELINENVKLRAANEQLLKLQHLSSHQVSISISSSGLLVSGLLDNFAAQLLWLSAPTSGNMPAGN